MLFKRLSGEALKQPATTTDKLERALAFLYLEIIPKPLIP
jgi:hypothetical protein